MNTLTAAWNLWLAGKLPDTYLLWADFSVVLFRPNFMLASEGHLVKVHKNQRLLTMPSPPNLPCGATNQGTYPRVGGADAFAVPYRGPAPSDVGLQAIENKALSWGIIGKSAPMLAEITIRKSQWGLELFWWARIGKLLQAFAITTVVLEIVGPERVQQFGTQLHGTLSWDKIKKLLSDAHLYRQSWKRYMAGIDELARLETLSSNTLHTLLLVVVPIAGGFLAWRWLEWRDMLFFTPFALALYVFISAYVTTFVLMAALSAGWILDVLLVEPTAYMLERPHLDKLLKLAALLAAIVGLHFDFLAS